MKAIFADTFFYLALVNRDDASHRKAADFARTFHGPTLTTAWVLTEVADALAGFAHRALFLGLLRQLRGGPDVTIVPASQDLFDEGVDLFGRRPDKEWSLTDCISFVVMEKHGITDALTADRHFSQAGYRALLL